MSKLTNDAKLAEIFPPEDLAEYDAFEEAQAIAKNLRPENIAKAKRRAMYAEINAELEAKEAAIDAYYERNPDGRVAVKTLRNPKYPPPMSSADLKNTVYPPIQWTLERLIREGVPQTLDGDGGIGKSSVSVGISVARAAGVKIFGKRTIQGPCLFVTHEDDAPDLQAMATAYAADLKVDLADLPVEWWSLLENDITLATIDDNGAWKHGPFYAAFEAKLKASPRGLFVVLDCRSDVVQMNEVLREPPNTFYKTILTPLCKRYGCTILVLCHPSKAAMSDGSWYSGGTGNKSALRNKLVMKLEDPKNERGPRLFGVLKRNRGDWEALTRLSFDAERGIYVADDDAAVQQGQRELYTLVVDSVLELVGKGIPVLRSNRGEGRSPDDVAEYINREKKPETAVTGKMVADTLKIAEDTQALVYVKGTSKTKAGYQAGSIE